MTQQLSAADFFRALPPEEQQAELAKLSTEAQAALLYDWRFWARPNQLAPAGDWRTWLALAGRGFGKTEAGAQWIRERVEAGARSIALVAETQKDLEEVMVARLLKISPPGMMPSVRYKPVRVTWPNGALALGYNGTEPDQLRGPEFDTAWVDELAKYRYARETWDMLQFTMRSGTDPRVFVTTTPRPIPVLREIIADPTTAITRGSTMDNASNLPPAFMKSVVDKYAGTRLGRQELNAEMLDDVPGALWTRDMLDTTRRKEAPEMRRIVISVDPSGTAGAGSDNVGDDIGIVAAGLGFDGRGYVLDDHSCNLSPDGWGRRVREVYSLHGADRIIAERNFGGAMVEAVIKAQDRSLPVKVVTASRGKVARAEPIAALYEQGRVSHIGGLAHLEDQMCSMTPSGYVGEGSPDRADALVWALTELMLDGAPPWSSAL
jgi:phage terminase large subunit-like protein